MVEKTAESAHSKDHNEMNINFNASNTPIKQDSSNQSPLLTQYPILK